MGLLRGRHDGGDTRRFQMKQKLASIGDDFWIEDQHGARAFKVNGKAARIRETFVLEDATGREVAKIQERKLSVRDKIDIERDGHTVATVHKALVGIRDRFVIDLDGGEGLKAHGNVLDHELRSSVTVTRWRTSRRSGSASGTRTGWRSPRARTRHCCWRSSSPSRPSRTE